MVNRASHAYTASALKIEAVFFSESFVTAFYITGCFNSTDHNINLFF